MDDMASAEFRKRYARLTKPTIVTVNGHAIGKWQPIGSVAEYMERKLVAAATGTTAQAQRDDLLRKINRSR